MDLETTPSIGLEEILKHKASQFKQLQDKLSILNGHNIEVSYSLGLTREEQVKYGNLGSYILYLDTNRRSETYSLKDNNS